MKNKRKWISKVALTLGVLTMLGSAGAGAIPIAHAEDQIISSNPVSDKTSARKITLWKYEIKSSAELGERGDGDPSTPPDMTGKQVMQDVKFEIIKVKAIGNASLTDPLKQKEDEDWEIDTSFAKMEGTTDENGKLVFEVSKLLDADKKNLANGIYLVREVPNAEGEYTYTKPADPSATPPAEAQKGLKVTKPMDPFFVHLPQTKRDETGKLIYDVHVHPKNIVTDTKLDKTVEGGKGYSIKAGNSFQWEATTTLPDGLYALASQDMIVTNYIDPLNPNAEDPSTTGVDTAFKEGDPIYASYFKVSDTINENLLLEDVEVYAIGKDGSKVKLTNTGATTEYSVTLTVGGTDKVNPNPVKDLTEGAEKSVVVRLTKDGMKKIGVDELPKLQVVYKVTTNKDFNGTISNQYKIDYLLPGGTPDTGTSDEPEYYTGGFDIKKTDEKLAVLENAEFHIADSLANANAKKYLASDGKSYTLNDDGTTDPALPTDVTFVTAKSGADGRAKFNGLKLDWYTESGNNNKQDPEIPSEATWDKIKQNETDPYISKKYWVVETKAPSGYELIKDPVEITVTLQTENAAVELDIVNKTKTDLPFTGGAGMTLMIVIALGAITIGTATIVLEKKRRQA